MIIDGKNLILGRAASYIAKKSLQGEDVDVINCEEMFITGNKAEVFQKYLHKKNEMGLHSKGPFWPRRPDMFVKKTVRGMLPYKQPKGRVALKKIKCYIGMPSDIKGKAETLSFALVDKVPNLKYISLGEVCKRLGWLK
jgi:large subunit ribosomal protein L13